MLHSFTSNIEEIGNHCDAQEKNTVLIHELCQRRNETSSRKLNSWTIFLSFYVGKSGDDNGFDRFKDINSVSILEKMSSERWNFGTWERYILCN